MCVSHTIISYFQLLQPHLLVIFDVAYLHFSVFDCPNSQWSAMLIVYLSSGESDSGFSDILLLIQAPSSLLCLLLPTMPLVSMTVTWYFTSDLWNSWFYVPQLFVMWNIVQYFLQFVLGFIKKLSSEWILRNIYIWHGEVF